MKATIAAATIIALAISLTPASAEDRPVLKAPTKTLGDEGKLPPTETMSKKVPDMKGPAVPTDSSTQGSADGTAPGATPPKRMGDEGKLPATSTMTDQVPNMRSK